MRFCSEAALFAYFVALTIGSSFENDEGIVELTRTMKNAQLGVSLSNKINNKEKLGKIENTIVAPKENDKRASIVLKAIIDKRLNVELSDDTLYREKIDKAKDKIARAATDEGFCFEIDALESVHVHDLVRASIIIEKLTKEKNSATKQNLYALKFALENDLYALLLALKNARLIPDGRILSIQNWRDNFVNYFIDAYEQDCLTIDLLGEIRLQLLKKSLENDKKHYSSNFVNAFIEWNHNISARLAFPFRTLHVSQGECLGFARFLDFYFQRWYYPRENYVQSLMMYDVIDSNLIDFLMMTNHQSFMNLLSLSPTHIMEFWQTKEQYPAIKNINKKSISKTDNNLVKTFSLQEKRWIFFMNSCDSCPKSVNHLRESFIGLSSDVQEQLISNSMDCKKKLVNLAFYSHFKAFHSPEQLSELFSETIRSSSSNLFQTFNDCKFPIGDFTAVAEAIAYDWIDTEQAPMLQDLESAIRTQIIKGFRIKNIRQDENYRSLRLSLLFQKAGPNVLHRMDEIVEKFDRNSINMPLRIRPWWIQTTYSLLRKDSRYAVILIQPILFEFITLEDKILLVDDYPGRILCALADHPFLSKDRPDLLSRMLDPSFDHWLAASKVDRVLQMNDADMQDYVAFGEDGG